MRPARIVFRAVLLAAGCAVMLATPPPRPSLTARTTTWLPAGAAQTLQFGAPCPEWEQAMLYVNPKASHEGPRLVVIVSPTPPPAEALALLKPGMDFNRGEPLGALGKVAFTTFSEHWLGLGKETSFPDVRGPGPFYVTVFAPDAALSPEFAFLPTRGCDSEDKTDARVLQHWPPVPDGGSIEGDGR
jgi:hypothetical protein